MTNLTPFDIERAKRGAKVIAFDVGADRYNVETIMFGAHGYSAARLATGSVYSFSNATGKALEFSNIVFYMAEPQIPEGYIRHDGGAVCPVCRDNYGDKISWMDRWGVTHMTTVRDLNWDDNIIAYRLKPAVSEPSVDDVIENIVQSAFPPDYSTGHRTIAENLSREKQILATSWLHQFAAAIIKEARR